MDQEKPEIGMSETGGEVTTVGKSQSVWEISESDLGLRRKPGDELKKTWGTDAFWKNTAVWRKQ